MYKFVRTKIFVFADGRSSETVLDEIENLPSFQDAIKVYETFYKYDYALFTKNKSDESEKEVVTTKDLTYSFRVENIIIQGEIQGLEKDAEALYREDP